MILYCFLFSTFAAELIIYRYEEDIVINVDDGIIYCCAG